MPICRFAMKKGVGAGVTVGVTHVLLDSCWNGLVRVCMHFTNECYQFAANYDELITNS